MSERVPQHAHCEICGQVVTVGKRVCSDDCQEKLDEATKMKKRSAILFVALIVVLLVLVNVRWPL